MSVTLQLVRKWSMNVRATRSEMGTSTHWSRMWASSGFIQIMNFPSRKITTGTFFILFGM